MAEIELIPLVINDGGDTEYREMDEDDDERVPYGLLHLDREYDEDATTRSTNSTSWVTYQSITRSSDAGDYRIDCEAIWNYSSIFTKAHFRLYVDSTNTYFHVHLTPSLFSNDNVLSFFVVINLTAGSHTFELQYHGESGNTVGVDFSAFACQKW